MPLHWADVMRPAGREYPFNSQYFYEVRVNGNVEPQRYCSGALAVQGVRKTYIWLAAGFRSLNALHVQGLVHVVSQSPD